MGEPMSVNCNSIDLMSASYSKSLVERGFHKGNLRTLKPCQSTGIAYTSRIILGMVLLGKLEVQTAVGVHSFLKNEEFMLPANLYFQVSAGLNGATIYFARQKYKKQSIYL